MEDLVFSARKKRKLLDEDDDHALTPKKARLSHATPAKSVSRSSLIPGSAHPPSTTKTIPWTPQAPLSEESSRLINIQAALEQALSVSLATAQISPDPDTGLVPNVLNHMSLQERGLGVRVTVEDFKKLCWVWEWDGVTVPAHILALQESTASSAKKFASKKSKLSKNEDDDSDAEEQIGEDPEDNPFLAKAIPASGPEDEDPNPFMSLGKPPPLPPKDWIRRGMGFCVSSTMHVTRLDKSSPNKRVPAYGIGIEVDWSHEDVVNGRVGGMTAVARWTGGGNIRKKALRKKLDAWKELTTKESTKPIPIPLSNLPALPQAPAVSKLTQMVTSSTPRKLTFPSYLPTPLKSLPVTSTPSKGLSPPSKDSEGFMIPFPVIPGETPVTPHGPRPSELLGSGSSVGVATPSSGKRSLGIRTPSFGKAAAKLAAAYTPTSDGRTTPTNRFPDTSSVPSTPTNQTASASKAAPETPTSARRAALYERIRVKSESEGESVKKTAVTASVRSTEKEAGAHMPKKVVKMVGPEELRRRCTLGRLGTIAEAVWMLFSSAGTSGAGSMATTSTRKRRALERSEVVTAVVKSSTVPISEAEAIESLTMLCELCPFFLKTKVIGGEEWLEMPASTAPKPALASPGSVLSPSRIPTYTMPGPPGSPTRRSAGGSMPPGSPSRRQIIEEELLSRSPKRIKKEEGGLRQVREIIRRQLEVDEDDPFM